MITENLQEMVSGNNEKPANGMSEYDILLRHLDKKEKLPDIAQKESEPTAGITGNGRTSAHCIGSNKIDGHNKNAGSRTGQ